MSVLETPFHPVINSKRTTIIGLVHYPEDGGTILREAATKLLPYSQLHRAKLPIGYPHATQTGTTQQVLMSEERENSAIIYTASVFELMFACMNSNATRNAYRIHYPT
jgi:hypothetical protein